MIKSPKSRAQGFTLLEVILAMMIVGMVLGTLFSLLAGSKRLAFKASDEIGETLFLRTALNVYQVLEKPEYPQLPNEYAKELSAQTDSLLDPPDRQTQKIPLGLEPYILKDARSGIQVNSVRWKKLEAVR
ncbi:MAG: type II secretion system protein [Thiotrichaceae bacterium]|nr:type II secretion system protein [Thiotrichaceae bacterium]